MTETITVADLTFAVVRSTQRRTAEICVERDGSLVIRAPKGAAGAALERFAHQRRQWVYQKLALRDELVGTPPTREYVAGEGFPYLGRTYRLALVDAQDAALKLRDGRFYLRRREADRGRDTFIAWYTAHGQPWLEARAGGWADRMDAGSVKVRVRDLGFRWGSCGSSGLNFHWATITLPPAVIDYVIVHELAHLEHPDHGDGFWAAVDRTLPTAKQTKSLLANLGPRSLV